MIVSTGRNPDRTESAKKGKARFCRNRTRKPYARKLSRMAGRMVVFHYLKTHIQTTDGLMTMLWEEGHFHGNENH